MGEISEATVNEINHAIGEALIVVPGEETVVLATVLSGYTELVSLDPSNNGYLERLSLTLLKLAEFLVERGGRDLAQKLIRLRDNVLKG